MKQPSDLRIPFEWQNRRSVLLEKFLYIPSFYDQHKEFGELPFEELFARTQPCFVEYCSGNGQWIAASAKASPDLNWIAVEKDFERARKTWLKIFREKLDNLFVVCGEGIVFSRHYLPKRSCSGIYVNFPDPWPKRIHAKHRIVRKEFLDTLEEILLPGASATLVTDDATYSEQMIRLFTADKRWRSAFGEPHYVTELDGFGSSYFYQLWKNLQRTIRYHRFLHA